MKKRNMLVGISTVALTLATTGCAPQDNGNSNSFGTSQIASGEAEEFEIEKESGFDDCEKMELVQGEAYSGGEDEVWYCNDEKSAQNGSFFMPFLAGYLTSSMLSSKHGIDASKYKPGSSKKVVSSSVYNKSAKKPLPGFKKATPKVSTPKKNINSSTGSSASKNSISTRSSGFGSKSFSSGG